MIIGKSNPVAKKTTIFQGLIFAFSQETLLQPCNGKKKFLMIFGIIE